MAGNVCTNVDQIRRQGRWNNTMINGAYLTNLPRELVQSMAVFPAYGRFFYLARAALNPPTSLCTKLTQSWRSYSTYRRWKCICTGDHDVQEDFYTRLGAHDGPPPLLLYPIWHHSIFSDPAYLSFKRDMLQIEAQEHDPAPHTPPTMCVYAL
ncbi:hypothetical protein [Absidia glauca]|uniref:Ndc10 domain-containing protein n=1 Tax=Absidia glauca TaxID=4829 RepID=A0A163JD19_ABSGL|nr:hypothetical protein [Absidia glauca]